MTFFVRRTKNLVLHKCTVAPNTNDQIETYNRISEQSLAESHRFEDLLNQNESRINRAKYKEEEDIKRLDHEMEAINRNMENKIEDLKKKIMNDSFNCVQEGLASINNSICSKAGRKPGKHRK